MGFRLRYKAPVIAGHVHGVGQGRGHLDEGAAVTAAVVAALPSEKSPINRYLLYFGPSEYQRLAKLDHHLDRAVDLGWNWILPISQILLRVLNWVFGLVHNYGVAILVLAIPARAPD